MKELLTEFKMGWRTVGMLINPPDSYALPPSDRFYLLGWWWEGEHIRVPEQLNEEQIAKELDELFLDDSNGKYRTADIYPTLNRGNVGHRGQVGLSTTTPSTPLGINSSAQYGPAILTGGSSSAALIVNVTSGPTVGHWSWNSVKIAINKPPSKIRKWTTQILLGAVYEPTTQPSLMKKSSPTPLLVLSKYLDSIKTLSTQTPSTSSYSMIGSPCNLEGMRS